MRTYWRLEREKMRSAWDEGKSPSVLAPEYKASYLLDIVHRPAFYLNTTFRTLYSVSVFRCDLLRWAQQIQLISVSGDAQLSRFRLKTETESSVRNVVFK
jgi:hypothetical protein